jgi:hypothetical protein
LPVLSQQTKECLPIKVRKSNKDRRDEAIRGRVNELYNIKRLRWDDVVRKVAEEFFVAPSTVKTALKN